MALRRFCGKGNASDNGMNFVAVKEREVTESRTDHHRAHSRDHLVLQPPFIPTYGGNIRVNGQASKESN